MPDRRLELAGVATIAVAGAAVWLLWHPEAPIVERATRWPVVGPAARALRERYAPQPPPATPPAPEPEGGGTRPTGPDAAVEPAPPAHAPSVSAANAAPIVRRFASRDAVEPVGPLPARAADLRRLELAEAELGDEVTRLALGRYELLTDLGARNSWIDRWRPVIAASERAWEERYGVAPLGDAAETIVVFARAESFHAYAAGAGVAAPAAGGLTGWGIVAVDAEGRSTVELDGVFQHELAHLLARRSIGPALPEWLAEGLAEDFGEAPLGADGRFDFGCVRGAVVWEDSRFEVRGGLSALDRAGRRLAAGILPTLTPVDGEELAAAPAGVPERDLYADAFAWVRFLLAEPERARGFRAFLAAVRGGEPPSVTALERRLPRPLAALAPELASWLLETRRRELLAHGAPAEMPDARGIVFGETVTNVPED